jgi:hypothetical protein
MMPTLRALYLVAAHLELGGIHARGDGMPVDGGAGAQASRDQTLTR